MITQPWGHLSYFCLSDSRNWSSAWLSKNLNRIALFQGLNFFFRFLNDWKLNSANIERSIVFFHLWGNKSYLFTRTTASFTKLWITKHFDFHRTANNYSMIIRRAKRAYLHNNSTLTLFKINNLQRVSRTLVVKISERVKVLEDAPFVKVDRLIL